MPLKQSACTPSRALTLYELDMAYSEVKQEPTVGTAPPRPASSGAKTLAQLISDTMPPPRRNNITSARKPTNSVQKTHLSTSKKQVQLRKSDHTAVRRTLNFIATNPMSLTQSACTPSRALTLCELDMAYSGVKQKPTVGTVSPRLASSGAKTLAQLISDTMPAPRQNNITSVRKPTNLVQKTHLSTSKKQVQLRKSEHTIVRRALNFIATNPIEDVQVTHSKISRHTLAPRFQHNEKNVKTKVKTFIPMSKGKSKNEANIRKTATPEENSLNKPTAANANTCPYELRSRTTTSESNDTTTANNNIPMFTQYRNINESFDISIQEEGSPQVIPVEQSILEPEQKIQVSQLSALMCRTDLKSNQTDITQKIRDIQDKIHENLQNSEKQMEFLTYIFDEVSKNKQILSTCIESNKQIMNMTDGLLKALNNECGTVEKTCKKNQLTHIPLSNSAGKRPLLEKLHRQSSISYVKPNTPIKNDEVEDLLSFENLNLRSRTKNIQAANTECVDDKKENVAPSQNKLYSPRSKSSPFPRRSVSRPLYEKFRRESMRASTILSASSEAMGMDDLSHDKNSVNSLKENTSPFNRKSISRPLYEKYRRESLITQVKPNTSLERNHINDLAVNLKKTQSPEKANSPRGKNSPHSQQRKVNYLRRALLNFTVESKNNIPKSPSLPKTSSKRPASPSPRTTKSQQMFKSLKESVQFLKTPVGKGKRSISDNMATEIETPNTKSRNITSNNIKRQLKNLYDS